MSGRGRGRGNGKGADAPVSRPGHSREILAHSIDAMMEQFREAMAELERRADEHMAFLQRIEQKLDQMLDGQEELAQMAFNLGSRPPGRSGRPPHDH